MATKKNLTRKRVPWRGWNKIKPTYHQRTLMKEKCGKKCFLGPNKSFPVCAKNTCKISTKGLWAAYVRSKEWGNKKRTYKGRSHPKYSRSTYKNIARNAKKKLIQRGEVVGK